MFGFNVFQIVFMLLGAATLAAGIVLTILQSRWWIGAIVVGFLIIVLSIFPPHFQLWFESPLVIGPAETQVVMDLTPTPVLKAESTPSCPASTGSSASAIASCSQQVIINADKTATPTEQVLVVIATATQPAPTATQLPNAEPTEEKLQPTNVPIVAAPSVTMSPLDLEFGSFTEGKWSTGQVDVSWVKTNACNFVYRAWRGVKPNIYDTNPDADRRYNTPWVHLFCGTEGTSDTLIRLDRPTLYQIISKEIKFAIIRDNSANGASNPSPYITALSGDPNLQSGKPGYKKELSFYIQGTGSIELNNGTWFELKPADFWQVPFPENLGSGILFHLKNFKGELWQGSQELSDDKIHNEIQLPMVTLK